MSHPEYPDRLNNHKRFYERRKELRNNPTNEEALLWSHLKGSQTGYKFRRQHSVGGYILDFYCPSKKLAIEIDGSPHLFKKDYDAERTRFLESVGVKVLRFWNEEVNKGIQEVVIRIFNELEL